MGLRRDPATGLPIIDGSDPDHILLQIISDGKNISVHDKHTKNQVMGIAEIAWVVTPQGTTLSLRFAPGTYELVLDNAHPDAMGQGEAEIVCIQPPAETAPNWRLKDQEKLVIRHPETQDVVAFLKVQLPKGLKQITGSGGKGEQPPGSGGGAPPPSE